MHFVYFKLRNPGYWGRLVACVALGSGAVPLCIGDG